ncbi:MAG: nucleotidyltransferase domain-containing protein [Chthoniobacterales bacterium]
MQLVLACARTQLNPAAAREIVCAARQPLDWFKAADLASYHRLSPVLISEVQQHATARVPETLRLRLIERFRAHTIRNFELTGELLEILSLLEESSLPALAFKGPVLTQQLYGQLALREFVDLDILVAPTHASTVISLLSAKGFEPQFTLTRQQIARFQGIKHHIALYHAAKRVLVEVHWALLSPGYTFSPAAQIAWESTQIVSIAGRSINTFSHETQLLFTCLHQAKHNWSRLGWLMDLAALIRQSPALDWHQIQNRAGSFGTGRMIRVGLQLVQLLFQVTLPARITQWAVDDVCSVKLAERILKRLLSVDTTAEKPMPLDPLFRASMESFADRAFYWFDAILRPSPLEWALLPLPNRLYALYYPIRVARLVCKHTAGRLLPARRAPLVAQAC